MEQRYKRSIREIISANRGQSSNLDVRVEPSGSFGGALRPNRP